MDPTEGALDALNEMVSVGLTVFIVTTPDTKHTARSAFEKITWIERHLGQEWKRRTILAHDKTLVKGGFYDVTRTTWKKTLNKWVDLIVAIGHDTDDYYSL